MSFVEREELEADLRALLDPQQMSDYCPNGLQVEGVPRIRKVIVGVTASLDLIELAIARQADAIVVHHGLMWKGDPQVVRGFRKTRLQQALMHDLNVFAWHLPLDVHPELGNNVQLGRMFGWQARRQVGEKGLVQVAELDSAIELGDLVQQIEEELEAPCLLEGQVEVERLVKTVAWCTGGAAGFVEAAALAGADAYLTGELSEPSVHIARELGVSLLGAGHHATERCGIQALGAWIAERYDIEVEFHDLFVSV